MTPSRVRALHAAFFGSGFAALLYEVVWERLLSLFSGSGVVSSTLVVAAFLSGLGLGSLAGGVFADRLSARGCVGVFAAANAAIAMFALASPALLYGVVFEELVPLAASNALIFSVSFACLLVPTGLMGLSLPCLARAVAGADERDAAARIARLYAADLAGAAAGTFLTGWWLQGTFGLVGTIRIGAAVSIATTALALLARPAFPAERPPRGTAEAPAVDARTREWALLLLVAGFLSISLEIVWFRYVGVILQSSAYVFAHVLGVFLVFDAVGLWAGARVIAGVRDLRTLFAVLVAGPVLWTTAALGVLGRPPMNALNEFALEDRSALSSAFVLGFVPLALIAVPAVAIGMVFPVAQAAVQKESSHVGRRVGLLALAVIVGNAAGSLITGLVLLERFGTPGTLAVLAAVGAAACLWGVPWGRQGIARAALAAATALAAAAFPDVSRFWPQTSNIYPVAGGRVFGAEDRTGVSVLRTGGAASDVYIHGRLQGRIPYMEIHCALGLMGPLLRPEATRVLVIGVGSGATPYCAGARPSVRTIEAVEIVGSSLDVLRRFAEETGHPATRALFADPRYTFIVDDARRQLALRRGRYDVIEADAISRESSHSGMLYSVEFFREVLAHLEPRGLMVQWRATPRVEATFRSVFPHGVAAGPLLIGSPHPVGWSARDLHVALASPEIAAWLGRAGMEPASFRMFAEGGDEWSGTASAPPAALNTDLFPRDEFYLNDAGR